MSGADIGPFGLYPPCEISASLFCFQVVGRLRPEVFPARQSAHKEGEFMQRKRFSSPPDTLLTGFLLMLALTASATASQKKTLYTFTGGKDGGYPTYPALIFDSAGNLYGTTNGGGVGPHGRFGTVFELIPKADGSWKEKVLYRFAGHRDGALPFSGLVFDRSGNLYGTTALGGGRGSCSIEGVNYYCGTVFEMKPTGNGHWTEMVLMRFDNRATGGNPTEGVIFDDAGNLYGVAGLGRGCGGGGCGMAFELSPTAKGPWKEKIVYSFHGSDGAAPHSPLLFDHNGNLYGTTVSGGASYAGVVFKLTPTKNGVWKETVLHSFDPFQNYDGAHPCGILALDSAGNLFGSTQLGGRHSCDGRGCGMVYKLERETWKETALFDFDGRNFKGISNDEQGVAFDASGNLFGTASGTTVYPGGIFELTPQPEGKWKEHLISRFPSDVFPGMTVYGKDGNLYGMTNEGGAYNQGTIFEVVP